MSKESPKVAKLRAQRDAINNRIQRQLAREQRVQREQQERKVRLVGEAILEQVEQGHWPEERLIALMDKRLTTAKDRAVFGLEPLEGRERSGEESEGKQDGAAELE